MSLVTVMPFDGSASHDKTTLALSPDSTLEEWKGYGRKLSDAKEKLQWLVGEWLAHGEDKWGEKITYAEAAKESRYSYGELRNIASVFRRVSARADNLSFSHHREVAALEPPEQKRWLDKAEQQDWSTRELHDQLRLTRSTESPKGGTPRDLSATPERIPKCSRCQQPCRPCEIEITRKTKKPRKMSAR